MTTQILEHIPLETYLRNEALSASDLKNLRVSPRRFVYERENLTPPSPSMALGSAGHCAILEPDTFRDRFVKWKGDKRGKAYLDFKAAHPDEIILSESEHMAAMDMCKSVHEHPLASKLFAHGKSELSIFWDETRHGLPARARLDRWNDVMHAVVDLKTARSVDPRGFGRQAHNLGYHIQAAWYQDAAGAAFGGIPPVYIVAVESRPPHDVVVYRVPERAIELGRDEIIMGLDTYLACKDRGRWPGICDEELELELPPYAFSDVGNEKIDEILDGERDE